MKKIFLFLLTVAITGIVCLWRAPSVQAVKTSGNAGENITWNFDAGTGTLSFTGSGEMELPSYASWNDYDEDVTSIVIGEGITSIDRLAFSGLRQVTSVSFPDSLQVIEESAFSGCSNLTQIPFTDNITTIGSGAFDDCSALKEIVIPPKVTVIADGAFFGCSGAEKLVLHSGITTIENDAFGFCINIKELEIPDSVTEIGSRAFSDCRGLTKVSIGKNVQKMNAFAGCTSLTEITIPDSVREIGNHAFMHCENLKKVNIGAGVSKISYDVFDGCNNLKDLSVSPNNPNYCSVDGVIYNKDKTELILLPKGISGAYTVLPGTKTVKEYAGYQCESLTSLTIPASVKTLEQYAFAWCTGMTSVTLSEGFSEIGYRSFAWCKALPEITIPKTLTEIGMGGFNGCVALTKITFTGSPPNIKQEAFGSVTATIYYPGKISSWRNKRDLYGGLPTWVALNCEGAHQEQTLEGRAPTCTDSGLTTGKYCAVCGETIETQKKIAANGHTFGPWQEEQAATETIPGIAKRTCSVCGEVEKKYTPTLTGQIPTDPAGNTVPVPEPTEPTMEEATGATGSDSTGEIVESPGEETTQPTATEPTASTQNAEKPQEKPRSAWQTVVLIVVVGLGGGCAVLLYFRRRQI